MNRTKWRSEPGLALSCPLLGVAFLLGLTSSACTRELDSESSVREVSQKATQEVGPFTCGYEVETGTYTTWPGGYQAWVKVTNLEGVIGTDFSIFLDVGDHAEIVDLYQADYEQVEGGYLVSAPTWLKWQTIAEGSSFQFGFVGSGDYEDVVPYVVSVNETSCDIDPPTIELDVEKHLVTSAGPFTLDAEATDGVAVRQVTFTMDGEVIAVDTEAPYSFLVELSEADNGRHEFAATATDFSGNEATESDSVLVAIGNRYLGSAASGPSDLEAMLPYFDQLTPENAGKWGNVEAVRGEFDWDQLDEAYVFAQAHDMRFRMHTLVWGQQSPDWLAELPAEEQIAELEEWMAAVAERYPLIETIDVVNEPLHDPPVYAEALGGAGETGWDWVIAAFELARQYFPEKELLLNDYQIVIFEQFTQDYLEIIERLQERDLIDGIGIQAHFLERAEPSAVGSNLALLAATGLPIYVSEFDINFADDARHANVIRDLFTIFWSNPSVLGVTNWGHLQGDTWQPNAYLIRSDGTLRPGFDWMLCFIDDGTDCTVPEYVPSGWRGSDYGVTLEAELYDNAAGVLALGNAVGYADPGDWLSFVGVEFQEGWDTFSVTYAKGNDEEGSISVYLDGLSTEPVLNVPLPNTGGWGVSNTIEVPWPAIATTKDVYVTFNDVYGVGNIDKFSFGTEPPETGVNLVEDPGFESGTIGGWTAWYGGGTLGVTSDAAFVHSGNYALVMTERATANGQNPIYQVPTASVSAGTTYAVSVWALHNNTDQGQDTLRLSGIINCQEDLGHNAYPWIQNVTGVPAGTYTQLSGTLSIPAECTPTEVAFYVDGPSSGVDIYVDDAVFINPNLIENPGFEEGHFDAWDAWYLGGILDLSSDPVYSGDFALHMSGRSEASGFSPRLLVPIASLVEGTTYQVSVYASHNGASPQTLRLSGIVQCDDPPDGHNAYPWIQNIGDVGPGDWVQLAGSLEVPDCDPTEVAIYVEGPEAGVELFIDNAFFGAP